MQTLKQYLEGRFNSPIIKEIGVDNINSFTSALGLDKPELIVKIHQELLKAKPVSKEKYFELTGFSKEEGGTLLENFGEIDEHDRITGFAGLTLNPTRHKFMVNGKNLYTWCALDAIVFTDWLEVKSHVISQDPVNNIPIELEMEKDNLHWAKPYPLYISWVKTINTCDIRGSVCNHVNFFGSEATANQWLENNPNSKVFSIDELFKSSKF